VSQHLHSSSPAGVVCPRCGESTALTAFELGLLRRFTPTFDGVEYPLPLPTLCAECRLQRRLAWRGELHLFRRKSALSGKDFISFVPPESGGLVYSRDDFWGDGWDPLDFGRDFDFSRPFFEQFAELLRTAPMLGLTGLNNQNSEFVNNAANNKNCYLIAASNFNEDCYYGNYVIYCKNCIDNLFLFRSELCYECISCSDCYRLHHCNLCTGCQDSAFLFDCRRCKFCFGCVNLVDAQYCFFNRQLDREDYFRQISELGLDRRSNLEAVRKRFKTHRLTFPHRANIVERGENVSGNFIRSSRNVLNCFDVENIEDCANCAWLHNSRDCMDIYAFGLPAELCYENSGIGWNAYRTFFSFQSSGSRDIWYCANVNYSSCCFGCSGMVRKEYCIFNRQYSKQDYEQLAGKIVRHMHETGEWGEFFPMTVALLPYNTSIAQDYFPLDKQQAQTMGLFWREEDDTLSASSQPLPESIHDLTREQLRATYRSTVSGKAFRIIPQEFDFLREVGIALPSATIIERHLNRIAQRPPRHLWQRTCVECGAEVSSCYAPQCKERVYCEQCYAQAIYN
jgi:hypothetical protein